MSCNVNRYDEMATNRYSWNTAEAGIKHQSINQWNENKTNVSSGCLNIKSGTKHGIFASVVN